MDDQDVYIVVGQQNVGAALAVMVFSTLTIAAVAHIKMQWSGWWVPLAAAVLVLPLTSLVFARFRWLGGSLRDYFVEVVVPLSPIGLLSAAFGFLIGWAVFQLLMRAA